MPNHSLTNHFDVIVVGVGTMGSAACWALAARGVKVLGLEQFSIPHANGSHHGDSRMIRQAYFEHPDYVALLKQVYPLWREIEAEVGQTLFHQVGALYLGHPACELIEGSQRAAVLHNVPHEVIPGIEVTERFPAFCCPEDWVGFFEPEAGYLQPAASILAMVRLALRQGATMKSHDAVLAWKQLDNGQVKVTTSRGEYWADRLIVCSGAWSARLLGKLSCSLTVTRQVVTYVWPKVEAIFQAPNLPCWAIDPQPAGHYQGIYYGFPFSTEPLGVKIGWHAPGVISDPDRVDREIHAVDLEWLPDFVAQYMPQASTQLLSAATCLYTYSPDGHFIVDHHPEFNSVCFAAGFSGHGFKFAPIMGQALADLALDGKTSLPLGFLSHSRF